VLVNERGCVEYFNHRDGIVVKTVCP
jgi:hypothetical protein